MYKTRVTENTKKNQQTGVVSNPIYSDLPNLKEISKVNNAQYRIINSIMFFGLAGVALTIFYKAIMSLML